MKSKIRGCHIIIIDEVCAYCGYAKTIDEWWMAKYIWWANHFLYIFSGQGIFMDCMYELTKFFPLKLAASDRWGASLHFVPQYILVIGPLLRESCCWLCIFHECFRFFCLCKSVHKLYVQIWSIWPSFYGNYFNVGLIHISAIMPKLFEPSLIFKRYEKKTFKYTSRFSIILYTTGMAQEENHHQNDTYTIK